MDTTTKWIIGVISIVIIGFGAYALWGHGSSAPAVTTGSDTGATANPPTDTSTDGGNPSTGASVMVVTYSDNGFSPASLTVTVGQTVQFIDKSTNQMWIASDPHPTHQGYDGTTEQVHCAAGYTGPAPFDECHPANTFSFTFTKEGSWGYHNHFDSSSHGTIVVASGSSTTH